MDGKCCVRTLTYETLPNMTRATPPPDPKKMMSKRRHPVPSSLLWQKQPLENRCIVLNTPKISENCEPKQFQQILLLPARKDWKWSYFMQNGRNELMALMIRLGIMSASKMAPVDITLQIRSVSGWWWSADVTCMVILWETVKFFNLVCIFSIIRGDKNLNWRL